MELTENGRAVVRTSGVRSNCSSGPQAVGRRPIVKKQRRTRIERKYRKPRSRYHHVGLFDLPAVPKEAYRFEHLRNREGGQG